jgi:hypothetical protein
MYVWCAPCASLGARPARSSLAAAAAVVKNPPQLEADSKEAKTVASSKRPTCQPCQSRRTS